MQFRVLGLWINETQGVKLWGQTERERKIKEMGIEIGGSIEKVNGKEISYNEFVERYLAKNQPVVLTGLMDDWRACKDWVFDSGKPNLKFFSTHFGNSKVQVIYLLKFHLFFYICCYHTGIGILWIFEVSFFIGFVLYVLLGWFLWAFYLIC